MLQSLPSYLSQFRKLKYLDCRNNNISKVDGDLKELIENNDIESYFSENAVCETDISLDCDPLCSNVCWSRNALKNGVCDITCNSTECKHDGGQCN